MPELQPSQPWSEEEGAPPPFRGPSWEVYKTLQLLLPWPECMATFSFDGRGRAVLQLDGKEIRETGVLITKESGEVDTERLLEFLLRVITASRR